MQTGSILVRTTNKVILVNIFSEIPVPRVRSVQEETSSVKLVFPVLSARTCPLSKRRVGTFCAAQQPLRGSKDISSQVAAEVKASSTSDHDICEKYKHIQIK